MCTEFWLVVCHLWQLCYSCVLMMTCNISFESCVFVKVFCKKAQDIDNSLEKCSLSNQSVDEQWKTNATATDQDLHICSVSLNNPSMSHTTWQQSFKVHHFFLSSLWQRHNLTRTVSGIYKPEIPQWKPGKSIRREVWLTNFTWHSRSSRDKRNTKTKDVRRT